MGRENKEVNPNQLLFLVQDFSSVLPNYYQMEDSPEIVSKQMRKVYRRPKKLVDSSSQTSTKIK